MSKGHRTYVTVYEFTPNDFANLDRSVHIESSDFFEDVVPFKHEWGDVSYIELEDLEYDERENQLTFTCETKWHTPSDWIKAASSTPYFSGKLILAAGVSSYENHVEGLAFMNHDVLQEAVLLDIPHAVISEMYENDEVDLVDDLIWNPIQEFNRKCEELYIDEFPCAGV